MPSIWEVAKAVRRSDLPAPARHIMQTLALMADIETAVVAYEFTPSLSTLADMTGLGRSTVARMLDLLDESGWVDRVQPTKARQRSERARTQYKLSVPTSPRTGLVPERDYSTSPGVGLGSPGAGPEVVPERDGSSPAAGHVTTKSTTKSTTKNSSSSAKPPKVTTGKPQRDDVEQVCAYLADKIEANGSKRPAITKQWRTDARLLLDEPRPIPVTVDKVLRAIDWCQADSFWRKNILSMPKLREKYDQLRLAAQDKPRNGNGYRPYRNDDIPPANYDKELRT